MSRFKSRFSKQDKAKAVGLVLSGESVSAVAEKLGVSKQVLRVWILRSGVYLRGHPQAKTMAVLQEVLVLRAELWSCASIAKKVGISYSTVKNLCVGAGLEGTPVLHLRSRKKQNMEDVAVGMRREGRTLKDIGLALGVSKQRVQQMLAKKEMKFCRLCGHELPFKKKES